jgi:multidrug transporter EmrE-like cation transporter
MSSMAHIFLKKGMMVHALHAEKSSEIFYHIWAVGTNTWIISGMLLHVSALIVWLLALSRVDISFAYPFLALGYVFVSAVAWYWLGEDLSGTRIFGMIIIVIGIFVLSSAG